MKTYRICLLCFRKQIQKKIDCTKHYTPTPLVNHLRSAHKEQYEEYLVRANDIKKKSKITTSTKMKPITEHFPPVATTKENFNRKYAKWIVTNNMPLKTGESSEFKDMIQSLSKAVTPPDYRSTIDMLTVKKLQTTAKLKVAIKGKYFSLTADHWTSLANENFGAITLHYIANFELKTSVLSCAKHENGATAKEMENQLVSDMRSWELERDFFIGIVTDTAANMNSLGREIEERWDTKYARHVYCTDHILQLTAVIAFSGDVAVENFAEDTSVGCLKKARDLVSHTNSSTAANEKLWKAQRMINPTGFVYKLLQDVVTRWGSTFKLVERVVKLEESIKEMFLQEFRNRTSVNQPTLLEKYSLSDEDFDGLRNILHILKPLQSAQKALEGDKYVSISLVPYIIHQLRIELEGCLGAANPDTQNDLISLLDKMIDDFNSRWGEESSYSHQTRRGDRNRQIGIHAYPYWAMALDPRTKKYLPKILTNHREIRRLWDDIEEFCLEEARTTRIPRAEDHVDGEVERGAENPIVRQRNRCGAASFFPESSDEEMDDAGVSGALSVQEIVCNEIRKYQSDKGLRLQTDGCYNCPLEWWRVHHLDYPHIWKIAERILAIPATSAPSERVFSSAANIVDKKRVRLKPENVDLLVFLRGNKDFVDWD